MALTHPLRSNGEFISRFGSQSIEVFSKDEHLPAPVGGIITLPSAGYTFKESFSLGTDKLALGPGFTGEISVDNTRNVAITYEGTGTMWTVNNAARLAFVGMGYILTGAGATFIEVTGTGVNLQNGIVEFQAANQTIGVFTDCFGVYSNLMYFPGFTHGVRIIRGSNVNIQNMILQSSGLGTGSIISIEGFSGAFGPLCEVKGLSVIAGANESVFYIDPCVEKVVSISNTVASGYKDFYEVRDTGPIASFTDVSTSAKAILSVSNDGGEALFESTAHGLVVGETPVHSTFSESTYNVSNRVTAVPSANYYKTGVAYVSDDSGIFDTTTCQVNDVAHGRSYDDCLGIFDTVNLGGGYKIFNALTNSFEITLGKAFPGTETGNWSTSSLVSGPPYGSPHINSSQNGEGVKNSKNIGKWLVDGNTAETDTSATGVFVDFNLAGLAVPAGNIEGWTVVGSTTGAIRDDGLFASNLSYKGTIASSSSGGIQQFNIRLLRSRGGAAFTVLDPPDDVDEKIGVAAGLQSQTVEWQIESIPGDIYKMVIANITGSSKIVINTVKAGPE